MDLPCTLYGQLYLLAYDRRRRRFDHGKLWLLGYALRAAMLTELFQAGHLQDADGTARRAGGRVPADPLLRMAIETVAADDPQPWSALVAMDHDGARRLVQAQLENSGWVCPQRRKSLGLFPARRPAPYDEAVVGALADRAGQAVRRAIAGRLADPRALTLGLLATLGELPALLGTGELAESRPKLQELVLGAVVPIVGLHQAIEAVYAELRPSGAGCGSGCGGGCGGCGGCGG